MQDNIPGVKGIGPKTAAALLQHFESIENMYRVLGLEGLVEVPAELADLSPTNKQLQQHLMAAITERGSAEVYSRALQQLRVALAGASAKAETVLARLYQCGHGNLLLYKHLVTLKHDIEVEDMLLSGSTAQGYGSGAGTANDATRPVGTDHFRYRGENALALAAAVAGASALPAEGAVVEQGQASAGSSSSSSLQLQLEELFNAISPSLLPTLQLLREQYHKLDRL